MQAVNIPMLCVTYVEMVTLLESGGDVCTVLTLTSAVNVIMEADMLWITNFIDLCLQTN